jgi:hypothetical protein
MTQNTFIFQKKIQELQEMISNIEAENNELRSLIEKKMTSAEQEEASKLHKKVSKAPFEKQYGKEKGEKVYYATLQKQAMKNK